MPENLPEIKKKKMNLMHIENAYQVPENINENNQH